MSFTNPKPGGYAFGEKLPSGHVNTIWGNLSNALDGLDGGAYTLVTLLELLGAGLKLSGANHKVGGTLTVLSGGFVTVASGGAVSVASGGVVALASGSSITVASGASIAWTSGSTNTGTKTDATTTTHTGLRFNTGVDVPNTYPIAIDDLNTPLTVPTVDHLVITDVTVTGSTGAVIMPSFGAEGFMLQIYMRSATGTDSLDVFVEPDEVTPVITMTRTTAAYTRWWWDGSTWVLILALNQ